MVKSMGFLLRRTHNSLAIRFLFKHFRFDRAPYASPKRQDPGNRGDEAEEKEMAIALKEALEATVCMVSEL